MGFKEWFDDKFGGGGSESSSSSGSYDIDYDELDRNDSYSPYQNTKESGQAYKQYQQAYNQYQQAQRNQNEYAGWQTDDMSAANARATTENARQATESAYQNWQKTVNPLVPNTPSYTPTYQNARNPFAAYDPAEWQISQAESARNSPTDYLTGAERAAEEARRNAQTGNGVYGAPKTSNPFGPATSQTQYYPWERPNLDQTDTRGTDASNPLFPSGKLESSPDTGSRGSIIDRFRKDAETLESMYYNPVKEPQFNLGDMLKNGRNLLFPERTDEQKAAKAELDQAKFELAHSGGSKRAAAQERLDKAQAAYDDVTKKLEKEAVTAVDNGTTGNNPKLQELYDSMSPFRRALRRFELAAEGGLQLGALATFVTTPLTAATSALQILAGDIPTALDIPLAARFAYQVANGKANPVKEGVGVESFTQKQWDALPESAKYQLSTIYKITNLDEFNEALKIANDLVRSNDAYKEGMSNLRDEYLFDEKIKAFHDYSQRMVDEAGYGLNKFKQFAIKLIPSGIDMAVDAVFNNWSGLAHAGLGLMADRIFGETYYDDRLAGHDHEHASAHALASAVVEVTSELIGGESVMDTLAYGNKGVFTEGIDAAIAKIGNPLMQAAAKYAAGTGSEILEEEFSQVVSPFVDALLEESPYLQTVIEKYGEQRAHEYVEAALGAILLTGVGNATGDIATSVANRAWEARGKYEAPNIDGTTTEENPNGKKAYSQTMQQVANINRNRNMDQNQLIQSIYGRAKEAGASDEQAKAVANDVYDMKGKAGKDIYNEFVKFNDGTKTREEIDAAIEAFKPELLEAEEGYVVLDADNKPVGTVKTVNDYGITIQFNDGTTESAILNGVGSGGMLDPDSRLAKVLGDNGTVVDADTADIYSRNAEQERKAQVKAGEEMQDRGEKAQPQTAPQPKQEQPRQTSGEQRAEQNAPQAPNQQQTTQQETPKQEAPTGPQFQNQDVYDNNKYEVEQSANGYYVKQPDGGLVGPFETYEQAMGMVSQFSQQNPTPQTQETQEAETPVQTQEESQPKANQEQEAPSEPEAPPSRSPLTDSVTEANTITENNGTPSKAEQYFADNPKKTTYQTTYKEAGVKIKKNADGTYTVSMASPKKNGQGWTKSVSVIGTVNSISEANQLVVDEYSKKSAPKALTDSATGTPLKSPQNPSQSVSQEEGNSVLPNEQNASEVQNEELNSKPEAEAKEQPQNPLIQTEEKTGTETSDELSLESARKAFDEGSMTFDEWYDKFFRYNGNDPYGDTQAGHELFAEQNAPSDSMAEEAEEYFYGGTETYDYMHALDNATNQFTTVLRNGYDKSNGRIKPKTISDAISQASQVYENIMGVPEEDFDGPTGPVDLPVLIRNVVEDAIDKGDVDYARAVYDAYSRLKKHDSYDDILSKIDANISEEFLEDAFDYIDVYAEVIAANSDNPAFKRTRRHESINHEGYLASVIKADLLRRVNLAKQSQQKENQKKNPLSDHAPVAEDDHGNKLTKNVADFFRNSKLRDALGRLRTFFHGTKNLEHKSYDFNYADDGLTMWLSDSHDITKTYVGTERQASYFDEEEGVVGDDYEAYYIKLDETNANELSDNFNSLIQSIKDRLATGNVNLDSYLNDYISRFKEAVDKAKSDSVPTSELTQITSDLEDEVLFGKLELTDAEMGRVALLSDQIYGLSTIVMRGDVGKQASVPVYVNMENPLVVEGKGDNWNAIGLPKEVYNTLKTIGRDADPTDYRPNKLTLTQEEKDEILRVYTDVFEKYWPSVSKYLADIPMFSDRAEEVQDTYYHIVSPEELEDFLSFDEIWKTPATEKFKSLLEEINEKEAYDIIDGLDKQIEKGQIPGETIFSARTRDIALAAYALGYDGVLIKDITDYGPNTEEMGVETFLTHDILAVFSSNQVKDVKNENPTKSEDYRYKERLSDDEELARLDGGIAYSEFNPDRPLTAEKAHKLRKADRIERAQKWAKHFGIKDGTVGLYDRLIQYVVDSDSAVTDAQREEIFALLAESASVKMNEQEQRMARVDDSAESDTAEDSTAETESKYSDPSRGFDFTPDESDAEDAYDWKKVSAYMAENNRDTALARKAVLEELFPEKEFRVSDDGGSIEEVYGHTTTKNPLSKEERSWWRKHGWEEINKKFKKNFFQVKNLIPAWLRNGTYNKNLTDVTEDGRMGNRLSVHSMQYNGLRYYYQVGEGMYRHILNSNIMNGVSEVISRHEKLVAKLKERIETGYQLAETPNALTDISTEQALQGVQQLEKKLKAEEGWLEKVRSGKYTLGNFYSDRSGVVTKADVQTVLDSIKGEDKTFDTFSLKSLGNAMSESAAKELIDSIYKEATDGLYSRGINGDSSAVQPGEQTAGVQLGQLDNGDSQWRSEETGRAPSSVTDRTTYDESPGSINGRDVLPRRNSRRSNAVESGTDGSVSGEQRTDGQTVGVGDDSTNRRRDFRTRSERSAEELNNKLKIRGFRLGKSGGNGKRITARLDGKSTFLDGDVTPRVQGGGAVADIINKAFESLNIVVNGITGNIYNFHGEFDAPGGMFAPKSSGWYTNPVSGYYNATKGRVLLRNIDGSNHNDVVKTARHELQHRINERIPNIDAFARKLLKNVGADYDQATTRIKYTYGFVMGMDNDRIADEVLSRIADGDGFGTGMITAEQAAQLYEALTTSAEWQSAIGTADDVRALFRGTSSQIFTDDTSLTNLGRNKAPTVISQNAQQHTEAPQEQRITNIAFNSFGTETQQADAARKEAGKQTAKQRGIDLGLTREENIQSLADSIRDALRDRNYGLAQQMLSYASEQDMRLRQDLDQYSDESFDALVNDTSYEEASAINGQNYDQYDLNSELGAEQASETETLNSMSGRGVDTTAAPIENFQNAEQESENAAMEDLSGTGVDTERTPIDYFQSQEQASESDLIREQSRNDLTGSEDTNFESPYEAEQRTEQEAMDSLYENMDGRKLTSPKRTANDYYGSAYARVQETQKKHKRNKARSSFSIAELYYKTYGETNDSIRNFKRLQRLNSNVDSLLDGKMSYYDFNSFAKNMSSRQGIGQILNDDIQSELDRVVALEEAAQDKNASEQDVADFQYAAANVVSHIVARMDMVEKTERARARLDTAAKKHGAKGGRKNLVGTALDAWNRYQITGDNFWRMMDDWAGKGQGYSYAREHLRTIATRISEEAKLKGYFEGIDKNSKEFKDFASGTTMSNVDFNGHKISLMEGIKFVKTVDTLRMFASENGRPSWQRVAALGGFTFEGKNGKPIFVDIQGSYDNNAEARAKWVEQRYNQLKQEIANNKSASAYMSAVEEMYYEASKDAEKVHSKVNGYDRYMYGKGWYTDIHYAKKGDGSVDFRYSDRDATDVHDTASMQRRTKVAGGYAIINPMSRSVDAYISQISNYIAFEEFGQKLSVLSDSKSINGSYANTVRDAYGDQYAQWFDNYVKTMTLYKDHKPKGGMNSALAKARQAMMSGALIGSVSVPIKQVSSFFDTMGTLDPRAVAAVFVQNPLGRKQKGIENYLMDSRNQSISDPDLAELFGDKGILRKIKDTRIGKLAMSATNMMDATAVSNVYRACVLDVEYNNPLGKGIYNNGKNFKDGLSAEGQFYVDAKFEEALLGSQPIFTPQARNELARTDNQFARMFSTFRTQQTQNYNRMLQTWNEYQAARKNDGDTKETGKKFVQTMTGQMIASASLSALTAIANAVLHKHKRYKDDDDELDEEKFWQRFGIGAFESLMGNSLFVGDITKWAIDLYNSQNDSNWNWKYSTKESQYFDAIEGMHIPIPASGAIGTAIQALNSAINLYRDVDENGWSDQNKLSARYLAGNIATAFGVQLNNVYYALNAGYQWYMDAAQFFTGNKKYEQKYDDIFTQMVKVDYSQQNRLVNSILAGKTQKVADMFDDMGQDKFENAVYYGAFDQYKAGKIDKAEYVELLMNFAGKSYKEASNEVEKKSRLLESGISQYNGIDGRDGRKAFYDQYSDNFQSRDAYKQFFEDVKNGKAEGKHNTYYTQWYGQPQEVSANQSSIIDTMNRNIQAGNFSYATAKLLWENYYGYSTSRYSAWKFVGK